MKNKKDEDTLNKIISAAYKDAPLTDRLKVYLLARKNDEVKKIFDEYRITAGHIKKIKPDECPDYLIESVKAKVKPGEKIFILRPAFIFTAALLIITITVSLLVFHNKEEKPVYSKTEIELAEKQVKTSLVILNKIFKKTENMIQEDILLRRVGRPVHKSLTIINDVLIGG